MRIHDNHDLNLALETERIEQETAYLQQHCTYLYVGPVDQSGMNLFQ